jgi:hypothetical protein
MTAGLPASIQISTTDDSARKSACRKRSGPPSSATTRRPMTILPTDLPRVAVSNTMGYPTITTTVKMMRTAVLSAPSNCVSVAAHNISPTT